ncbi:MAG: hypothetical protein KF716_01270 [Anaerolineae bacterium]|nr:hypothetical protein [Anaerolineae bacterium]
MNTGKRIVARIVLLLIAVVLLLASNVNTASADGAKAIQDWSFGSTHSVLTSGVALYLKNYTIGKCLVYQQREYGINLGWTTNCQRNILLVRPPGQSSTILQGDMFAIYVNGGGYLRYKSRDYGINLVWSSTPVYEWSITRGIVQGVLYHNDRLALQNRVARDYMVYCERKYGINLRWMNDCDSGGLGVIID